MLRWTWVVVYKRWSVVDIRRDEGMREETVFLGGRGLECDGVEGSVWEEEE